MSDHLDKAYRLAERLRFSRDSLRHISDGDASRLAPILSSSYGNELRVCPEVTPDLAKSLAKACARLSIPGSVLHAFVYPSSEMQAECHAGTTAGCVVRFSSALIDNLDDEEFEFVAGHEIGHFLLDHSLARLDAQREALEFYMQSRYQEISVDRVGLVACGSLEVAIRALMKTVSGLNERHLRFDVGTFISQLGSASASTSSVATHPSILVRCRALLWFSLSQEFAAHSNSERSNEISMIDRRISADMDKYVDREARRLIDAAKAELAMWTATLKIVQRGAFRTTDQQRMSEMFGVETLGKLKSFLADIPSCDAERVIFDRVKEARNGLETLIPSGFETEVGKLQRQISDHFSK